MKEEKYIHSLFEKARLEEPIHSFEEVSFHFDAALNPSKITILRDWFFNHIYLNSFVIGLFFLFGFAFLNSQPNDKQAKTTPQLSSNLQLPKENNSTPIIIVKEPSPSVENKEVESVKTIEKATDPTVKSENIQTKKPTAIRIKGNMQASSSGNKITSPELKTTPNKEMPKDIKDQRHSKANSLSAEKSQTIFQLVYRH